MSVVRTGPLVVSALGAGAVGGSVLWLVLPLLALIALVFTVRSLRLRRQR